MDEYKLTVEYSREGSDEVNEKTINIDLQEYRNSYKEEASHLKNQYTKSEINKQVRPAKEQFIYDCISKNLNENERIISLIDPLVDRVDTYITESID